MELGEYRLLPPSESVDLPTPDPETRRWRSSFSPWLHLATFVVQVVLGALALSWYLLGRGRVNGNCLLPTVGEEQLGRWGPNAPEGNPAQPFPNRTHFHYSSQVRQHSVWGAGLTTAVPYATTTFYVDFLSKAGLNDSTSEILDSQQDMTMVLRGPALVDGNFEYVGSGRYLVSYFVVDPGVYEMSLEIFERGDHNYTFWLPLGESPYTVTIAHPNDPIPPPPPSSLSLPNVVCPDAKERPGRWLRCQDIGMSCVRYGWWWVPNDCYFPLYSPSFLIQQQHWIVFAGSSVTRGTFMAGVDFLLGDRASNLTKSSWWKCWGWLDITVGDLRLSYLDYRHECRATYPPPICQEHYEKDAITMFGMLGRGEYGGLEVDPEKGLTTPSMVVVEINEVFHYQSLHTVADVRDWLGPQWSGQVIAHWRAPSPIYSWREKIPQEFDRVRIETSHNPQWGVDYYDSRYMSRPIIEDMEYQPVKGTTLHWHKQCSDRGMHSCSALCDMDFQMVMHIANPDRASMPLQPSYDFSPATVPLRFCDRCPPRLDFSMRPDLLPVCYDDLPM